MQPEEMTGQEAAPVWSTGRLVIGIVSMVLFVLIGFQSCAAGLSHAMSNSEATSGTNGVMTAFFILVAGIVAVCTRKSRSQTVTMIPAAFYWLGAVLTLGTGATYGDLPVWGGISFLFGMVYVVAGIKTGKKKS